MAERELSFDFPIMHNREEVFAVKFSGCLKNACEMLISGMLNSDIKSWVIRYPGLTDFLSTYENQKESFYRLMYFTPRQFLKKCREPREGLSVRETEADLAAALDRYADPMMCSFTSLEVGMLELAKYKWCRKIIVYDTALNERDKRYIAGVFEKFADKTFFYEGFLKDLITDCDDVTSFFVDDVDELMDTMEYYETLDKKSYFNERQFFVQCLNAIEGVNEVGKPIFRYHKYMEDACARFNANVSWITSHYIDLNDMNPIASLDLTKNPKLESIKKNPD